MLADIIIPFWLRKVRKHTAHAELRILDIGCGNHSPKTTKRWFPACTYHGVDQAHYNIDQQDVESCDELFLTDIDEKGLADVTSDSYDVIIFKHVIEHLYNGDKVLEELVEKLKPGGIIYVEFPSTRSLTLPSGHGTLNFFDDETHVRHFPMSEIANILMGSKSRILEAGYVRDWVKVVFCWAYIPIQIMSLIKHGQISARGLWDLLGFAEYVVARKPE